MKKLFMVFTITGIWILPFSLIFVFLNPDSMHPHNRLGEPLALACLWILAIPRMKWTPATGTLFISILAIMVMKASYYVSEIANSRRQLFEGQLTAYRQMEFEAARKASHAHIPLKRENILLYRFHEGKYSAYDTMLNYPAMSYANPKRTINASQYQEQKYWNKCLAGQIPAAS